MEITVNIGQDDPVYETDALLNEISRMLGCMFYNVYVETRHNGGWTRKFTSVSEDSNV